MEPRKLVLIIAQMNDLAVRNIREFFNEVPIRFALHFYGAYHVTAHTGFKPHQNPVMKPFWITNYIRKNPVKIAEVLRFKGECIVRHK